MKRLLLLLCLITCGSIEPSSAQTTADRRAARLGLGVNLSYLEGYWNGSKASHFSNFVKLNEVPVRKQRLADIARAGFQTVRIPVCFGAWATIEPPYRWDAPQFLAAPDSLVRWALNNNLNVIIDLHHVEFDGSVPGADAPARVVWLWEQIAERYKATDPERVLFELRNEPHDITAAAWREQATQLIQAVRRIAPHHTLVVGFHDWNSRDAMIKSQPFADPNLLYTFHFYDPFVFTHQGATWSSAGLPDLRNVPFPATPATKITVPASARGTWVESAINNYASEATYERIYANLQAAKNWSVANKVPIFLGEFGSYGQNAQADSRCRHAEAIYFALGKLQIPSTWWEWDGGFSMFERGTSTLMPCMLAAVNTYRTGQLIVLGTEPTAGTTLRLFPNPVLDTLQIRGADAATATLTDAAGRSLGTFPVGTDGTLSLAKLSLGVYGVALLDKAGKVLGTARVLKQ
ncbi:glycoside hydrolase family 5 protein [Tellurirhabdus rosea]|uniref:glycoside hydrolase family 5 protein n=1 Tax=Tellurirhabdus rosea TaxID=2674997 RepID=UPI002259117B|nr:glycoside hydrolase family 5 protein [Tellurirhabdus rosea]